MKPNLDPRNGEGPTQEQKDLGSSDECMCVRVRVRRACMRACACAACVCAYVRACVHVRVCMSCVHVLGVCLVCACTCALVVLAGGGDVGVHLQPLFIMNSADRDGSQCIFIRNCDSCIFVTLNLALPVFAGKQAEAVSS